MAMQSAAVAVPEKVPVQWYNHQQQPSHHQMDEREGLLMWLRGEFAAANAMIDALCHHLRDVGETGEYDGVIASVQQRRCNWNPVLHMQQYFSVADVVYALQQVSWRRQQWAVEFEGNARTGGGGKDFRRGGRGYRAGPEVQNYGVGVNGKDQSNGYLKGNINTREKPDVGEKAKVEMKDGEKELNEKLEANGSSRRQGHSQETALPENDNVEPAGSSKEDGSGFVPGEKQNLTVSPKTFIATELFDGKNVNIAEGMKLYEDFVEDSETYKLITLVNNLRATGRRGQLQGQAFITRKPMRGHGREMIQLGIPAADAPPEDDSLAGTCKDLKTEPIPASLQDVIERLLAKQIVSIKPDSCIIDFYNEGDHSHPCMWPHWFVRPICVLFLTDCEMSFGKVLTTDHPGDHRGALKLSFHPGAMLVMEGRSADFTRHAIPSIRKQRILITLVKSLPKRANSGAAHHRIPYVPAPPSSWTPPPSRSPSHIHHPVPPTGVMPVPPPRPQLPPPRPQLPLSNGMTPIFVPTPVAAGIAFHAPVPLPPSSATWPAPAPQLRHPPPPRLPLPGTGVFLPPQGSASSAGITENVTTQTSTGSEEHRAGDSHGPTKVTENKCNGSINAVNVNEGTRSQNEDNDHGNRDPGASSA